MPLVEKALMKAVHIVGAGDFGREVFHWCRDALSADEYRIRGFIDTQRVETEHALRPAIRGDSSQ